MRSIVSQTAFLNAALFASREETRYYLQGVCFDGTGIAVATDGHRLYAEMQPTQWRFKVPRIMPITLTKFVGVGRPKWAKGRPAWIVIDHNTDDDLAATAGMAWGSLEDADKSKPESQMTFRFIDGVFPDWRKVVPRLDYGKPTVCGAYNSDLMATFGKVASGPGIRIVSTDDCGPALVDLGRPEAFGVLMPMRWNGAAQFQAPTWATAQLKEKPASKRKSKKKGGAK